MSLFVDEIFGNAVQGEGLEMGTPSIFVRTGGCNLTCSGFGCTLVSALDGETVITGCDSIHAVNAKHWKHTWSKYENYMDLVVDIKKVLPPEEVLGSGNAELPLIIFTGGEPLLQHKEEVMIQTIEYFYSRGFRILVETNATIDIDFDKYPIYRNVIFSMSVKMSASGEPKNKRWKPQVANNYLKNTKQSHFKFVLSRESLQNEADEIYEFLDQVPTYGIVYVMPKGETSKEVADNAYDVYEFAAKHSMRYSDRLHIRVHDAKRGV